MCIFPPNDPSSSRFALNPSHIHFILLTVGGPLPVAVSISIRVATIPVFSLSLSVPRRRRIRRFCPSVSRKRLFYISRWLDEKTPGEFRLRIVWRGAILDRTYSEFFALPTETIVCLGSTFRARCIRLSAAENNKRSRARARTHARARPGKTYVSELWRFASRIMLSVPYTLRSATSAKSRSRVLLRRNPLCEINWVVRKESSRRVAKSRALRYRRPLPLYAIVSRMREVVKGIYSRRARTA